MRWWISGSIFLVSRDFLRCSPVGREACLSICLPVCPSESGSCGSRLCLFFPLSSLFVEEGGWVLIYFSGERKRVGCGYLLKSFVGCLSALYLIMVVVHIFFHLFILFHDRCLVSTSLSALCSLFSALCSRPRSFCPPGLIPLGSLTRSRACMDLYMHPSIFLLYPDPPFIYFLSFGRALLLSMCI
jgi:hypothetical protein